MIDADFSACFTQVPGAALLQASGTGRRPDAVLAAILRGAEQALAQGFDPRRFARLQKSACGRLIRELDGSESTCYRICEAYFAGAGCFDELAALQAVTLREAESFLRRMKTRSVRLRRSLWTGTAVISALQPTVTPTDSA